MNKEDSLTDSRIYNLLRTPLQWLISYQLIIIIFLVSFGVYFNSLFNGFVYDDKPLILENYWIKDIKYLPEIFSRNLWAFEGQNSNYYRPLIHVIYMFNYYIFGLKPWGFHLTNILFHTGASVLVFLTASKLLKEPGSSMPLDSTPSSSLVSRPSSLVPHPSSLISPPSPIAHCPLPLASYFSPPFIAAILFAVHPIHTEAVAWVSGLMDTSFTFFYLLSFYLYIRSAGKSKTGYSLSVVSFFLAALCKEPALTLLFILVAYDYLFRKEEILSSLHPALQKTTGVKPWSLTAVRQVSLHLKRYVPYFIAAGIYLIIRLYAVRGFAPIKSYALSSYQYFINVFPLFMRCLEKLILPMNLNASYVFYPITSLSESKGIISLSLTLIFIVSACAAMKKNKTVFFSLLLIVVPLLPGLYIPALGINYFAERYLYLPSLGFVMLLALLLAQLKNKIPKGAVIITAVSLTLTGLYSIGTINRNTVWKNNYTLWTTTVKASPDSDTAHHNLGVAYSEKGLTEKALIHFHTALQLNPKYAEAYYNIGNSYIEKGQIDEATKYFQTALSLNPRYGAAHMNLGIALLRKGLIDNAIEHFQTASRLNPNFSPIAHYNLGLAYNNSGLTDKAMEHFQTALRLNPDFADAHNNLGILYWEKGQTDKAIEHFQTALRLNPNDPYARHNLANVYMLIKGLTDKADRQRNNAKNPE